jgi:hypothetical protein
VFVVNPPSKEEFSDTFIELLDSSAVEVGTGLLSGELLSDFVFFTIDFLRNKLIGKKKGWNLLY